MKKIFTKVLIIGLVMVLGSELRAQSNWEVGARFGNSFSADITIPLSAAPRLHTALNFDNNFSFGTYFDWMFDLQGGPNGLKFYPGVGPEFYFGNSFNVAAAGDFGAEYSFDFPLTIGFDWRPHFMLSNGMKFSSNNWGFMARFRFGEGVKFTRSN
ncbi:hypothetical protein [Carboxylicivirga sp. N1Y90]|uniref:hypothetical protein n=1 Tax=Carboxylicivirga fragile TaxID=3417571 RepID=UPI003D354916|nr:hypothetical protein [Marinilabiliaceae bacterium N1Y90]